MWSLQVGEGLAVAVIKDEEVDGHLPKSISRIVFFLFSSTGRQCINM